MFLNNTMLIFLVYACSSNDERSISDAIGMENLTGLIFTESERDSALEGISLFRDKYDTMRTIQIPNQVPMPLYFNPRIIGQDLPKGRERYLFQEFPPKRPDNIEDCEFFTIGQLAYLVRTRQVSSLELTKM